MDNKRVDWTVIVTLPTVTPSLII